MSAYLLGTGFRADMGTCIRKLVLLKLIDACEEDGSRIFPAIATVARAAQCSDRQVQREIRAFVEIGLLSLVREGGRGRRSTNEYAMDLDVLAAISKAGWDAYAAGVLKGDTVSPLETGAKGDTGDTFRVTPETPKGDNGCHTTPPYPSLDPSSEREAREGEPEDGQSDRRANRKSVERAFERAFQAWPTSISDSRPEAWKAWQDLSVEERADAFAEAGRYIEAVKATGRQKFCAHGVYLREKRWLRIPAQAAVEQPLVTEAKPFGKLWQAARFRLLLTGPSGPMPTLTRIEQQMVAEGRYTAEEILSEKRVQTGFPAVNTMHDRAAHRQGVTVATDLKPIAGMMEAVRVGSDLWEEWRMAHRDRGWPWMPDPERQEWVYLPAGGPAGLGALEAALLGDEQAEAAE